MSNFGFMTLRVVNPYEVAFREARSAVRSRGILENAGEFSNVADAIADCELVVGTTSIGHRQLKHPLHRLEVASRLIRKHLAAGSVALLFGSEKFGLSNEEMSYCHWLLRIPTREEHGSMNLGQAVAVCLYELIRSSARVTPEKKRLASAADLVRFDDLLTEVLEKAGYLHAPSTDEKIRRLIRRLQLPAHDAEVWLGMFRQVLWKIGER